MQVYLLGQKCYLGKLALCVYIRFKRVEELTAFCLARVKTTAVNCTGDVCCCCFVVSLFIVIVSLFRNVVCIENEILKL